MAGLYQEGQRFPVSEAGKRFQTGPRPPLTMADYLRILETRRRATPIPEEVPSGLESANTPSPEGEIWRGKGLYGEQAFTNIPERAQAMGLRETMPPVPEGGYMETMPTGKTFAVEAPQAEAGGQGRSYAEKIKARQKLEAHVLENDIPMAEAMQLQKYWGVDNDSLDKAQKAEVVKEEKLPSKIEEFEMLYPEMKGRRGTPEYREAFGKMKPDTGSDELEARGRVSRLVNSQLQAKYGKTGARYDPISQQWVFPPNFNQEAFYKDYQALEKGYLKKFGITEVLPEQEIEAPEAQGQHPLAGQRPGRYMVDGKEVRWNGDMEL